jgi:hypothetical protein
MTAARFIAAIVLGFVAVGGVPRLPVQVKPTPHPDAPSDAMQQAVAPIAEALKDAPAGDRLLWARLWEKAATVVAGDAVATEVVFSDTRSLRAFTILALDIGWRRIGEHKPGHYRGLRDAVESAMGGVLSLEVKPVDDATRRAFAEMCRAIGWAGFPRG